MASIDDGNVPAFFQTEMSRTWYIIIHVVVNEIFNKSCSYYDGLTKKVVNNRFLDVECLGGSGRMLENGEQRSSIPILNANRVGIYKHGGYLIIGEKL